MKLSNNLRSGVFEHRIIIDVAGTMSLRSSFAIDDVPLLPNQLVITRSNFLLHTNSVQSFGKLNMVRKLRPES